MAEFHGGPGPDIFNGGADDDELNGNGGDDTLNGGAGDDVMRGGRGSDAYHVDSGADQVIEDAVAGVDTVHADLDWTLGANVENLVLTEAAGAGEARGNAARNVLTGNSFNNLLDGGAGNDTMAGGGGSDSYYVDSAGDRVIENAGEGISDEVIASISYTLGANIEWLVLDGAASINATGNALANRLIGNGGANRLDGMGGDDAMVGGGGDDVYVVDSAGDSITEEAGGGNDTVEARSSYTLGLEVENLRLTGIAALSGTGNALANNLWGNAGANRLDGAGGADVMRGGGGNDTYVVDDAGDQTIEAADQGVDMVEAGRSWVLGGNIENLTLTGTGDFSGTGNGLANRITGNDGGNQLTGGSGADALTGLGGADILDGGTGADLMVGGTGDDLYRVDDAGDRVTERAGEGTDVIVSAIGWTLASHFENLTLTGNAAIDGKGNGVANQLTGNGAANTLDGAGGADTMAGGGGSDVYIVDNAGDVVTEALNEGTDTVHSAVDYTLTDNVEDLYLTARALNGTGNALANRIYGNAAHNRLDGGGGNDELRGGLGNDIYVVDASGDLVVENAGEGIDTIESAVDRVLGNHVENLTLTGSAVTGTGNDLDNVLTGNAGVNTLVGGLGNDRLVGGAGGDTLRGGEGDDVYVLDGADRVHEQAGQGVDTVISSRFSTGLTSYDDVENLTLVGNAETGSGSAANNVIIGNAQANGLTGGDGDDTLIGGDGDDQLEGDAGIDTLTGGGGADYYSFFAPGDAGDIVTDFDVDEDMFRMEGTAFGVAIGTPAADAFVIGTAASDADDRVIYDPNTGRIWIDADGSGAGSAILLATVTPSTALTANHFIFY